MLTGLNDAARAELEDLRSGAAGLLLPANIVERARSPNSALHKYFEWDDTAAASAYRLQQARNVIRAVVQIVPRADGSATAVRAYISLPSDRAVSGGYRPVAEIVNDEWKTAEAFAELRRLLGRLRVRYGALAQIATVTDRIAEILEQETAASLPATMDHRG